MSEEKKCPDIEDLSAWIDSESSVDYSEHCASCEVCREIAEDFQKMDTVMDGLFNAPQADGSLPGKIMEDVNKAPALVKFDWTRNIIKIAAILVAALIISSLYKGDKQEVAGTDDNLTPVNTLEKKESLTVKNNANVDINSDTPPAVIPSENFKLVGNDTAAEAGTETLKGDVKHVWVSAEPQETIDLIKRLAFDGVILNSSTVDNKINMEISLTDKQLVKVVNRLSEEGSNLISRDLPQPNSSAVTTLGNIIRYNVTILKKN
jgi:hypothetical protein